VVGRERLPDFAQHGCELIALNARLDNSPEGELRGGILDVISDWERKKIAERTARGRLAKARKGLIVASRRTVSPTPMTAKAMKWTKSRWPP
jgi:DNA invertase Pin-like site-specific DNA recombinase